MRACNPLKHFSVLLVLAAVATFAAPQARAATVVANDVAINGESFFGASNIRDELTRLAREDSVIGPSETFRQIAVSGALIAQIVGYYHNASPKPKYLISDGGGNDLMGSCPSPATSDCSVIQNTVATVKTYFDSMTTGGTEKVLWMRYPDPQGTQWATLKTNQDLFNPLVKAICDTIQKPKCIWIDLRPVWEGHYADFTSDGIHPTTAGGTATAEAFWKVIKDSSFFAEAASIGSSPAARASTIGISGGSSLRVQVSEAGPHAVSVQDVTGRLIARRRGNGAAEYRFAEATTPGLYFVRVSAAGHEIFRKALVGR